jgi:hypothetical protein
MKTKIGCVLAAVQILVISPLSFYAQYLLLKHVGATDVMWLLFWINWPVSISLGMAMNAVREFVKE